MANPYQNMNGIQRFLAGVFQGGDQIGAGVAQLGINGLNDVGLMGPDAVARNQQIIAQQAQDMAQNNSFAGKAGQMAGNALPTLPVPVPMPVGGLIGHIAESAVREAANGALKPTNGNQTRAGNAVNSVSRAPGLLHWISMYSGS